MDKWSVLKERVISEKAFIAQEENKYVFVVDRKANKTEVKKAVEELFGVEVDKVNILNVKGKTKVFRGIKGKRPSYKKAIVTLKEGQTLKEL
ncbi:50S ribosomal protein L23 [Hippea maritima]|uniref:Large ribosomal subunit protein uL23 n=1 Tax=Hippea maritima (strain ATCC 700847 / DSM 10411 / MH2) TaxID=760142 RepID=F2LXU0_HIPMA|nr:50S ribosomal protein L23 [Hippea maritima]AEA34331.1 Ribosomal protein L25/L23 [Hippea maritima DSM 10411]